MPGKTLRDFKEWYDANARTGSPQACHFKVMEWIDNEFPSESSAPADPPASPEAAPEGDGDEPAKSHWGRRSKSDDGK
jgi:hypothetical protein